ncbi:MAG: DUF3108 domain-containing protein [bacterium]
MRNFFLIMFIVILVLLVSSFTLFSEQNAFKVGEKLVFSVGWTNVLDAGTAIMQVSNEEVFFGHNVYHTITTTKSSSAFSSFFYVYDRIDCYFDKETFASLKYEKHLREGDYKNDEVIYYDPKREIAVRDEKIIKVLPNTMDVLTAFYYLRTLSFKPGDVIKINQSDGKRSKVIEVKILKKERITVPAGTFDCIKVEPILNETEGIFRQSGRLWFWLTDDEKHMPVLMKSSIVIGDITAKLASYTSGK